MTIKQGALRAQGQRAPRSNRQHSVHSAVKYDLIGKLAEGTQLTRRLWPTYSRAERCRVRASSGPTRSTSSPRPTRLINEQKATMIVEHLAYDPVERTL